MLVGSRSHSTARVQVPDQRRAGIYRDFRPQSSSWCPWGKPYMGHIADSACSSIEGPCCPQPCITGQSRTRWGRGIRHPVVPSHQAHSHCPLQSLHLLSSPSGSALAPGAGTQLLHTSWECSPQRVPTGTGTHTGVAPGWVSHPCQESQRQTRHPSDGHPPLREPRSHMSDCELA